MTTEIDQLLSTQNGKKPEITKVLTKCIVDNQVYLGLLIAKIAMEYEFSPEFHILANKLTMLAKHGVSQPVIPPNTPIPKNDTLVATRTVVDTPVPTRPIIDTKVATRSVVDTKVATTPTEQDNGTKYTRVMMHCNWTDSKGLCDLWNKMTKGNYTWGNLKLVWQEPADYYVVVNSVPGHVKIDKSKTILFHMEPHMEKHKSRFGEYADPNPSEFFFCGKHSLARNNFEWHLSKTFEQLSSEIIIKDSELSNVMSTVLSDKYTDPGHCKRIDFVRYLEGKGIVSVHVYGGNKYRWQNYKGAPPSHCKDTALLPYKYTFNAENHSIPGYITEKLIDGILSECLTFYWGCPDARDYIDPMAYVQLDLIDPNKDMNTIKEAIENNLWEQRLPYIQKAKAKILNEQQILPRIERIINKEEKTKRV